MGSRLPIEVTSPTPEAMTALWEALCDDPMITDLPYKVETNQRGQLLMSPTSTPHSQTNDRRRGFNHGLDTTPVFHHPASVPFVEGSGHH